MKDEVFINLLGYKEPNLVHLMRCKVGRVVRCRVVEGSFSVLILLKEETSVYHDDFL